MAENKACEVLCEKPNKPVKLSKDQSNLLAKRIKQGYNVHL